jgi:hypothetical protein
MGLPIDTTVEIADSGLEEARAPARRERTTVRALIEEELRAVIARRKAVRPFRLPDASVGGQGLQPGVSSDRWAGIGDAICEGRGG